MRIENHGAGAGAGRVGRPAPFEKAGAAGSRARGKGSPRVRGFRASPLVAFLLATTAALPLLAASAATSRAAGDVDFDVPAGDLGGVLAQIGRAGSQPISFPADLTRGRRVGPIVGRMSVQAALARALSGTGLVTVPGAGGAMTVRAAVPTTGATAAAAGGDIAAIDVTDTRGGDVGFTAGSTQSSSRIDIPLRENPRSVVGVTQEVIRTQAQTSVLDTARNVSNVRIEEAGTSPGLNAASYTIRGFNQPSVLINGLAAPGGIGVPITDVERVDVIKGPTSDFTGPTFSGGAVNVIAKAPTAEPIRRMDVFYGSRFYRTLAFDFGGPVSGLDGVTYRLNVSGNTANYAFGGDRSPHEALISPVVSWQGVDTRVTAGVRYIDQVLGFPPIAVGAIDGNPRPFRVQRDYGFGNLDSFNAGRSLNPYMETEHRFGTYDAGGIGTFDFKFRNRTSYFLTDSAGAGYFPSSVQEIAAGQPLVRATGGVNAATGERIVTQSDILVGHTTEYFKQTMRFGIDYSGNDINAKSNNYYNGDLFSLRNPRLDIPLPSYQSESYFGGNFFAQTKLRSDNVGIAFQDKIDVLDRLHILGSVRRDWYNSSSVGSSPLVTEQTALTYNAGAVYDLLSWASVYGSVGTGFQPQTALINRTQLAPPILSDQNEYGIKLSLLEGQLTVTGSRFVNAFSNNILFDPVSQANVLGPGYRAEGYEFDFQGQVTPELQVIGGYSYTDFVNFRDLNAAPGTPPNVVPGQPGQQANLFAVYTIQTGPYQGFSMGGGARGQTFSFTDFLPRATAPKIPGFVTFDAVLGYRMENVRIDLNVRNIFDRYYYNTATNPSFVPVAQGRTFTVRASVDF